MTVKSYRTESKDDWGTTSEGPLTLEQINTGALLRIADAVEVMAKRYVDLIMDKERAEARAAVLQSRIDKEEHRVRGLRGALTRQRNRKK